MRAVNLVPPESRAGKVSAGKSGGLVYGVVGGLAVLFVMLVALASVKHDKATADQELASVQQSTQSYEAVATQFSSFETASKQANDRIALVRSLADARFDWAGTLRDMARLIPKQTQISSLNASVKDGTAAGSGNSQFRSQLPTAPAITIQGCSKSQTNVANLVTNLQAMRRVTNVSLENSETDGKLEDFDKNVKSLDDITDSSSTSSGGGNSSDSAGSSDNADDCSFPKPYYTFTVTVFYAAGKAQASVDAVPSAAGSSATTIGTETAGATTPASTTPAAGN